MQANASTNDDQIVAILVALDHADKNTREQALEALNASAMSDNDSFQNWALEQLSLTILSDQKPMELRLKAAMYLKNTFGRKNHKTALEKAHEAGQ